MFPPPQFRRDPESRRNPHPPLLPYSALSERRSYFPAYGVPQPHSTGCFWSADPTRLSARQESGYVAGEAVLWQYQFSAADRRTGFQPVCRADRRSTAIPPIRTNDPQMPYRESRTVPHGFSDCHVRSAPYPERNSGIPLQGSGAPHPVLSPGPHHRSGRYRCFLQAVRTEY